MKRISNINIRSIFKKDSKQRIDLEVRNEQSCSVNVTKLHTFAYTLEVLQSNSKLKDKREVAT